MNNRTTWTTEQQNNMNNRTWTTQTTKQQQYEDTKKCQLDSFDDKGLLQRTQLVRAPTTTKDSFGGLGWSTLIRRTNILRLRVERNPRSSSTLIGLSFPFGDEQTLLDRSAYILQTLVQLHFTIGIAHTVIQQSTSIVAHTTLHLTTAYYRSLCPR